MKKIQKEIKTYENVYVSVDGKEFKNEADCKAWESSYKGTLASSWALIKKVEANAASLGLPCASEDYECYIIKPESLDDIVLINAYIESSTYSGGMLTNKHIGQHLIINFGYDHEYCDVNPMAEHMDAITTYMSELMNKFNENA